MCVFLREIIMINLFFISAFSLCILGLTTGSAAAYIDPGTGSLLLQGLIAAIAGSLAAIKIYWSRIKSFFADKKENKPSED